MFKNVLIWIVLFVVLFLGFHVNAGEMLPETKKQYPANWVGHKVRTPKMGPTVYEVCLRGRLFAVNSAGGIVQVMTDSRTLRDQNEPMGCK